MILLFLLSLLAMAARPTVTSHSTVTNLYMPANTMMFTVSATAGPGGTANERKVQVGWTTSATSWGNCTAGAGGPWTFGTSQTFPSGGGTLTFPVYNLIPGTPIYYKVLVGSAMAGYDAYCSTGSLTPTLPAGLADLNLNFGTSGTVQSNYVLFDTDDCAGSSMNPTADKRMLVVVKGAGTGAGSIVRYLDVDAMSLGANTDGWRYEKGSGSQTGHITGTVDHRWIYDWNFDGSTNYAAIDIGDNCDADTGDAGPCVGHDAFYSTDTLSTYVITSEPSGIGTSGTGWEYPPSTDPTCNGSSATFVDDGYSVYGITSFGTSSGTASFSSDNFLIDDHSSGTGKNRYAPTGGPTYVPNDGEGECTSVYWNHSFEDAVIDWTHVNSLAAYKAGATEYLDMSLKEWDQVVRFNTSNGNIAWRLAGGTAPSDLTLSKNMSVTGSTAFADQHDVHTDPSSGYLYMFDNTGDTVSGGSRALRLTLTCSNPGSCTAAEITKSWLAVDPAATSNALQSLGQGSAEAVGASSMLLLANDHHLIEEFDDTASDGQTGHTPNLAINIPSHSAPTLWNACDGNGPVDRNDLNGWYRAYPLATVGEY